MTKPFWREKPLHDMTELEWESLCDGCGRCCLHKLEDEDTGEILFTRIACRLLDLSTCRCGNYRKRVKLVPDCLNLRQGFTQFHWLPSTCAYRLLAEGDDLPDWHPLVSGQADSVHAANISVRDFALSERQGHRPEDHVIEWLE
jgi:uncharacterized cysteine cluster protein YcgN (CxxCxxCC family)